MDIITLDFETYYDKEYSLSKMTTQEYILDARFEIILVSVKLNNGNPCYIEGTHEEIRKQLVANYNWDNATLVCHNTIFDGSILAWHLNIKPKRYFCTMMGSRPNVIPFTVNGRMSLSVIGDTLNTSTPKGYEIKHMIGLRRREMSYTEFTAYADYCMNDVSMTKEIYDKIIDDLPASEQRIIDLTLRKYIEPVLQLDLDVIREAQAQEALEKEAVLHHAMLQDRTLLMSNDKFADALLNLGVEPPRKISPTTGKETFAFAKTDPGMKALLVHDNVQVRLLAKARVKHKSTINETRLNRFANIALLMPSLFSIPLMYYGAHTGRFSGMDKLNLQNLGRGSALRKAIKAQRGHKIVAGDLSQIEARVTAVLAGEVGLIKAFASGEDVYTSFASEKLYGIPPDEITKEQRFIGKMCILGLGYGMGPDKFRETILAMAGLTITTHEAERVVKAYRFAYKKIVQLWRKANSVLDIMLNGGQMKFGPCTVVKDAIILPNGMKLHYPELYKDADGDYWYRYHDKFTKVYGGKIIENIVQALSRIILTTAELRLAARGYKAALSVHDELVYVIPQAKAEIFAMAVHSALTHKVSWLPGIPLAAEVSIGDNYAEAK